jgi:hypothetical protein
LLQQVRSEFRSLDTFVSNARPEASAFFEASMEMEVLVRYFAGRKLGSDSAPIRHLRQWEWLTGGGFGSWGRQVGD